MYVPEWVFGIAIIIGAYFYYTIKKRKEIIGEFSPFYVHVWPNWYKIFKEFNIINNDQEWQEVVGKLKENTDRNPLSKGIMFTVLRQDKKSDLVYLNNYNTFHSEVDFRFKIDEIEIEDKNHQGSKLFSFSPAFYIKWSIEGYELGITTPESFSKVIMVGDNNDLVKISTIPYALFHLPKYRFGILTEEQLKQLLEIDNWKLEDQDSEARLAGWPMMLENDYFTIHYKYI